LEDFNLLSSTTKGNKNQVFNEILRLLEKIGEKEKFMMQINKRLTNIERQAIINSVASEIKHEVDLMNPDKILLIEIVGNKAGLVLIKKMMFSLYSKGKEVYLSF